MRQTTLILSLLVMSVCISISSKAWSCNCSIANEQYMMERNQAVFAGLVKQIENLGVGEMWFESILRVTFEVFEVWKGPVRPIIQVQMSNVHSACQGYPFKKGKRYLVAADKVVNDDEKLEMAELEGIRLCGGTRLFSEAEKELQFLGVGHRVADEKFNNGGMEWPP